MLAAKNGHHECFAFLQKEMKKTDLDGWTALMYAAEGGHAQCLADLLTEAMTQNKEG